MTTTEPTDKLICIIPDVSPYDDLWTSPTSIVVGAINGVAGVGKANYYQPAPTITIPNGVILDGYTLTKKSINGKNAIDDAEFSAATLTLEAGYILGTSSYSKIQTVTQFAKEKIYPIDANYEEFIGKILAKTQIAGPLPIETPLTGDQYFEVQCKTNPSIDMWIEVDNLNNTYCVYADKKSSDIEKWSPYVHRGYYYLNEEEFYLGSNLYKYIDPGFTGAVSPNNAPIFIQGVKTDGGPVIVVKRDGDNISQEYRKTIPSDIKEVLTGSGTNSIILSTDMVITDSIYITIDGIPCATGFTCSGNVITLTSGVFTTGAKVVVEYQTIKLHEELIYKGNDSIFLSFNKIRPESLSLFVDGVKLPSASYSYDNISNKVELINTSIAKGTKIAATYLLLNSFSVEKGFSDSIGGWMKLRFIEEDTGIEIYYECIATTQYYEATDIVTNPLFSNNHSGFLYLSDEVYEPKTIEIICTPNMLNGNGYSEGNVFLVARDGYRNPVPNFTLTVNGPNILDADKYDLSRQAYVLKTDDGGQCAFRVRAMGQAGNMDYTIWAGELIGYLFTTIKCY
jgi:hypothetical protein